MIYLISFTMSAICIHAAYRMNIQKSRFVFVCLALAGILIPAVLGGLRDYSIGTDVLYYVMPDLGWANSFSGGVMDFLQNGPDREKMYSFIIYVAGKLFGSSYYAKGSWLLFFFQLINMVCVFLCAHKNRERVSPALVVLLFFLFHYNMSYNMIRQMMAETIMLAGISDLLDSKYKKFVLYVLVATLFHTGSIMVLLLIPVHYGVTKSGYERKREMLYELIVLGVIMVGIVALKPICMLLINSGVLSSRYAYYIQNAGDASSNFETLIYICIFFLYFVLSERIYRIRPETDFYRINLIVSIATLQLGRIIAWGNRFGMYFSIFNILAIASIPTFFKSGRSRKIVLAIIVLVSLLYWWYMYVYVGVSETYPYKSILAN